MKLILNPVGLLKLRIVRLPTILILLLLMLVTACSSNSNDPIISSEQQSGGPDYSGIIITTDMAVGENRILFGVIDREGMPVPGEASEIAVYFLGPGEDKRELKESVNATFTNWPTAVGGVFSANLNLDTAGFYEIDINYTSNNNLSVFAQASFMLKEEASTPAIGLSLIHI